jgi:arsenite-transporting ATPase
VAAAAPDRRVLLLSADPAHSIGDLLHQEFSDVPRAIAGGPPNLMVRELDASRGFAALRDRFAHGIEQLLDRTGGGSGDRQVLHDLLALAPPGVDELVAIIQVVENLDSAGGASAGDLIVIDTAPTGHALRLLEMPALVHDWVKAVMAILLKYRPVVGVGELGEALLRLSQGLARLRALLADPARTRFVVVTRPAALPRAETVRLLVRLEAASIGVPVVIVNAVGAGTCARCRSEQARQQKEMLTLSRALTGLRRRAPSLIVAPATVPPPAGWRDVQSFVRHWRPVPPEAGR